jgi:hypothetical protein
MLGYWAKEKWKYGRKPKTETDGKNRAKKDKNNKTIFKTLDNNNQKKNRKGKTIYNFNSFIIIFTTLLYYTISFYLNK